MSAKICFKCSEKKPLDEFYCHPMTTDGHLGKCKECAKKDVRDNRAKKREQYSEYERKRYQNPVRRAYARERNKLYTQRNPEKVRCRRKFAYALRKGRIKKPDKCGKCGATGVQIQAHHDDYSKPYQVNWLCFACHRKAHGQIVVTKNSTYINASTEET